MNISFSQNLPNIGGENCTVLGLRLMHRLPMARMHQDVCFQVNFLDKRCVTQRTFKGFCSSMLFQVCLQTSSERKNAFHRQDMKKAYLLT